MNFDITYSTLNLEGLLKHEKLDAYSLNVYNILLYIKNLKSGI